MFMLSRLWHRRRNHKDRVSITDLERWWTADEYTPSKLHEDAVPFKERVKHITWANFAIPMSTSSIAVVLAETPHRFPGLTTIGKVIFITDLIFFFLICAGITARFVLLPGSFKKSLLHPTEALFFPTAPLAVSNIISCIQLYGVPNTGVWLVKVVRALYWIYVALSFTIAVVQYFDLFTAPKQRLTIQSMTPGWILPVFPVMVNGSLAATIAPTQPESERFPILIAGVAFEGLAWMVAIYMSSIYLYRLMLHGLPAPNLRPGMYVALGPPAFLSLSMTGIADALPAHYGYFARHPSSIDILQTMSVFIAIFTWVTAFWFFCISTLGLIAGASRMTFHLVWFAPVFPLVGWTTATIRLGEALESPAVLWIASSMTILIVIAWIFIVLALLRALYRREIWMPGKDEDKDQFRDDDLKADIKMPIP